MPSISYSFENEQLQRDRIGAYDDESGLQIGFARLVTDYGRFAYLCDVYVLDGYQGQGIGRAMCQALIDHDSVKTVGHWTLATKDAHGVYAKLGFELAKERYMKMSRSSDRWQEHVSESRQVGKEPVAGVPD